MRGVDLVYFVLEEVFGEGDATFTTWKTTCLGTPSVCSSLWGWSHFFKEDWIYSEIQREWKWLQIHPPMHLALPPAFGCLFFFPPPPLATQAAEVLLIVKCSVNSPSITASQIPVRFLFPGTIIFEVQSMGFCSFPHPFHNFWSLNVGILILNVITSPCFYGFLGSLQMFAALMFVAFRSTAS